MRSLNAAAVKQRKTMMKVASKFLVFLSLAISVPSCTAISYTQKYTPQVNLDISPRTINKSVQIDRFKDASPAEDKKIRFMKGLSITHKKLLDDELDLQVTNAVVSDFSTGGLFKEAGREVENPDFIIKGEIKKFYGKSRTNAFAKISIIIGVAGFAFLATNWKLFFLAEMPSLSLHFGVPMSRNTSEIVIEMRLYDNHNRLINTYTGRATASRPATIYHSTMLDVSNITNRTFSKAIMQIREQILADADKLD